MAPPELAADAPVLNVLEPVVVDLFPALREETDQATSTLCFGASDGIASLNGLRIFQEPLLAQTRFDGDIGALAEADIVLVRLFIGEEPEFFQAFDSLRTCLEAVEPGEAFSRKVVERAVGIHDVDDGKVVPQADLVVGLVMGRGDLEDAGAELEVNRLVTDDRQLHLDIHGEGAADMLPDQVGVAGVLRIHGDGRVAHDRLGTGGRNLEPCAGALYDLELEVVEEALLLLRDDLLVAQRGE